MKINRLAVALCVSIPMFTGCFAKVNPFEMSDEAKMAEIADKVSFSDNIGKFLKDNSGSKFILVNMESSSFINDQLPEYMIHDALYTQIKEDYSDVELLARDSDILNLIEAETNTIEFCPAGGCSTVEEPAAEGVDSLTPEQRRLRVGTLLREITNELAEQDVLVLNEEECCGDSKKVTGELTTQMIANEVGEEKSELIQALVKEYVDLYDLPEEASKPAAIAKKQLSKELPKADYLFAYRIYDYGNWVQNNRTSSRRITYIKLHVRIVDMDTGEILVSDFLEETMEDTMSVKEKAALSRSKASQSDYGRPGRDKGFSGGGSGSSSGSNGGRVGIIGKIINSVKNLF